MSRALLAVNVLLALLDADHVEHAHVPLEAVRGARPELLVAL